METYRIYDIDGNVIHQGEAENFIAFIESKKNNLEKADLSVHNLAGADLSSANLEDADLSEADLSNVNLKEANLSSANLFGAHLFGADLSGADLFNTGLSCVRLEHFDLSFTNLSNADLQNAHMPIFSKWKITFSSENSNIENFSIEDLKIEIGCKEKSIPEWDKWFSGSEEYETKRGTFEFRQIEAHYEAVKAYLLKLYGGNE